jgi:DNA-binding protein HU-beta
MPDKKINIKDLAEIISEEKEVNVSKKEAEKIIKTLFDKITEKLKEGKGVRITSFGTFTPKTRHPRKGVNPRNPDEKINMPEVKVAKFKAGKKLKDSLKK